MYIHHEQYELSDQVAERLSDKDKNHISSQFITRITANNSYLNQNYSKQQLFKSYTLLTNGL
jgi:hypothetical protein